MRGDILGNTKPKKPQSRLRQAAQNLMKSVGQSMAEDAATIGSSGLGNDEFGSSSTQPRADHPIPNQKDTPQLTTVENAPAPELNLFKYDTPLVRDMAEQVKIQNPNEKPNGLNFRRYAETVEGAGYDPNARPTLSKLDKQKQLAHGLLALSGVVNGYMNTNAQANHVAQGGTAGMPFDFAKGALDNMQNIDAKAWEEFNHYRKLAEDGKLANVKQENAEAAAEYARQNQLDDRADARAYAEGQYQRKRGDALGDQEDQREWQEGQAENQREYQEEQAAKARAHQAKEAEKGRAHQTKMITERQKTSGKTENPISLEDQEKVKWLLDRKKDKAVKVARDNGASEEEILKIKSDYNEQKESFIREGDNALSTGLLSDANRELESVGLQREVSNALGDVLANGVPNKKDLEDLVPMAMKAFGKDEKTTREWIQHEAYTRLALDKDAIEREGETKGTKLETTRSEMKKNNKNLIKMLDLNPSALKTLNTIKNPEDQFAYINQLFNNGLIKIKPANRSGMQKMREESIQRLLTWNKDLINGIGQNGLTIDPRNGTYNNIKALSN